MKKNNKKLSINKLNSDNFRSTTFKIFFRLGILIILVALILILVFMALNSRKIEYLTYDESSRIDYSVNLKDNEYYDLKKLPSGMNYIASLIESIDINFDYVFATSDNIDLDAVYYVDAVTKVYGNEDKSTVLYEKKINLVENTSMNNKDNNLNSFKKTVRVDYAKFNDFVKSFKTSYSLTSNSDVTITLHVKGNAKSDEYTDDIKISGVASVVIPLTEQTVNINIDSRNIDNHNSISRHAGFSVVTVIFGTLAFLLSLLALIVLIQIIKYIKNYLRNITEYEKKLRKLLKEYDDVIVNVSSPITKGDHQVMKVSSFEELLDVHDNIGSPILYKEVIPGKVSHFVLVNEDIMYQYVLSDSELDGK